MPSVEEHIENIYLIVNDSYNEQFNNEEYTSLIPYFYTFYKVFNNPKDIEKCNFLLDKYFQKLSALGFVNGIGENNFFSQYSVLAEISLQSSIKESYKSDIKKIKQYLFHQTFDLLQRQDINHLSQIVSSLHYFSLNLPDITSEKYLKELLPLLYKLIKEKIYSSNSFYHEKNEELLHLGFAHGLSGVLLVLIGIYANGIKEKNIVDIVETGIKYILSFKREYIFYSCFYNIYYILFLNTVS
ncbi:MAG: lanthionine synthetase LanC family protein, partial [Bacteroidota bacterium]